MSETVVGRTYSLTRFTWMQVHVFTAYLVEHQYEGPRSPSPTRAYETRQAYAQMKT